MNKTITIGTVLRRTGLRVEGTGHSEPHRPNQPVPDPIEHEATHSRDEEVEGGSIVKVDRQGGAEAPLCDGRGHPSATREEFEEESSGWYEGANFRCESAALAKIPRDGSPLEALPRSQKSSVSEPRVGVRRIVSGHDVARFPAHARGKLMSRGPSALSVELVVLGAPRSKRKNASRIISERQQHLPGSVRLGAAPLESVELDVSLGDVDGRLMTPSTDDDTTPSLDVKKSLGDAWHRVGTISIA